MRKKIFIRFCKIGKRLLNYLDPVTDNTEVLKEQMRWHRYCQTELISCSEYVRQKEKKRVEEELLEQVPEGFLEGVV